MLITSPKILASHLKDCRVQQGKTQLHTAQSVGLRQATVSDFEKTPEYAQVMTLFKLVAALDLEIHLLPKAAANAEPQGDEW